MNIREHLNKTRYAIHVAEKAHQRTLEDLVNVGDTIEHDKGGKRTIAEVLYITTRRVRVWNSMTNKTYWIGDHFIIRKV